MRKVGHPYKQEKPDSSYDAIVVGSGIGGLATGVLLARQAGRRVLVLERHYTAGGFTHSFQRPGYEWDVGIHYIGEVHDPRSATARLFEYVTGGQVRWEFMGDVYDRICIGDETYDFVAGTDRFRARLKEYFPGEESAVDGYVSAVRGANAASRLYFAERALPAPIATVAGPVMRRGFLSYARQTTRAVLESLTKNQKLIGVLSAQYGDYGLPPRESSFAIHALVARHYLEGASYPVGGASSLAAGAARLIEAAGGRILVSAEVQEILIERDRAVGVRMADGREIRAPLVVSSVGALNTYQRLVPQAVAERRGLRRRLRGLDASVAHACLYIGLKGTDAELGLSRPNLWIFPGYDHDASVAAYRSDPEAPLPVVYASFPSAKDPSWRERHPDTATIDLITLAPYDRFARWAEARWGHRGAEYEALKENLAQRMLEVLYRHVPQVRGRIAHYELSTPLTTRHFANYPTGEIYGLAHTPARFLHRGLRPRTPIRNLYMTGQDVATCGVAGALIGGFLTASAILRRDMLKAAIGGR